MLGFALFSGCQLAGHLCYQSLAAIKLNITASYCTYKQGDSPTDRRCNEQAQIRLRVAIPKRYQQEPVSKLTSDYGRQVNITGAVLDSLKRDRGWFDLELRGTLNQIQKGIAYLEELELEIWGKPNTDGDSWHYQSEFQIWTVEQEYWNVET